MSEERLGENEEFSNKTPLGVEFFFLAAFYFLARMAASFEPLTKKEERNIFRLVRKHHPSKEELKCICDCPPGWVDKEMEHVVEPGTTPPCAMWKYIAMNQSNLHNAPGCNWVLHHVVFAFRSEEEANIARAAIGDTHWGRERTDGFELMGPYEEAGKKASLCCFSHSVGRHLAAAPLRRGTRERRRLQRVCDERRTVGAKMGFSVWREAAP